MLDTECANHARLWNGEAASATVMEFWRGFPPRFITEPPNLVKSRPETVASLTLRFPVCYLFSIFRHKKSAFRCEDGTAISTAIPSLHPHRGQSGTDALYRVASGSGMDAV